MDCKNHPKSRVKVGDFSRKGIPRVSMHDFTEWAPPENSALLFSALCTSLPWACPYVRWQRMQDGDYGDEVLRDGLWHARAGAR